VHLWAILWELHRASSRGFVYQYKVLLLCETETPLKLVLAEKVIDGFKKL
jgi:hypothetical protein